MSLPSALAEENGMARVFYDEMYDASGACRPHYREFARWLADDTVLLSYNGKSYDRPLLSTRYTLARQPDPVLGRAHIDLLHPARRRWRGVWENCRLATIEHRVLGVVREDDLPGAEAPTVVPLVGRPGQVAVQAVCQESVFWETLERLKLAGASAILVMPIEKMML